MQVALASAAAGIRTRDLLIASPANHSATKPHTSASQIRNHLKLVWNVTSIKRDDAAIKMHVLRSFVCLLTGYFCYKPTPMISLSLSHTHTRNAYLLINQNQHALSINTRSRKRRMKRNETETGEKKKKQNDT